MPLKELDMTTQALKDYCRRFVPLTQEELELVDKYFAPRVVEKNDYLLEAGKVCDFIAYIDKGIVRHFHIKDGLEKTCDISFTDRFITDYPSFYNQTPSEYYFQALQETHALTIKRESLFKLYAECPKYESLGRQMAELVAERATQIARSLSSDKPEERYKTLLAEHPEILQQVQQKYVANFLGISPESLSRIRSRIANRPKS